MTSPQCPTDALCFLDKGKYTKRKRVSCDQCRKRKVRCVPDGTGCERCSRDDEKCLRRHELNEEPPARVEFVEYLPEPPPSGASEAQKYYSDLMNFWREADPDKHTRFTGRLTPSDAFAIKTNVDKYGGYDNIDLDAWRKIADDIAGLTFHRGHLRRFYQAWFLDFERRRGILHTKDLSSSALIAEVPEPIFDSVSQFDEKPLAAFSKVPGCLSLGPRQPLNIPCSQDGAIEPLHTSPSQFFTGSLVELSVSAPNSTVSPTADLETATSAISSTSQIVVTSQLQQLDDHSRDLAILLALLGEADIPKRMLLCTTEERRYSNLVGDIEVLPALQLNPLFATVRHLDPTLKRLESLGLLHFCKALDEPIRVHPMLRSLVKRLPDGTIRSMKYKASLLVFHSFPIDPDNNTGILFGPWGRSQLAHIQHVLGYFDPPEFINRFSPQKRQQIILVCLSSSRFGNRDWKWRVLAAVEELIDASVLRQAPVLLAKLQLRRMVLSRQHYFREPERFPAIASWQSLLGEAWHELKWESSRIEQQCVMQKRVCLQIRICRFAGDFPGAERLLQSLETQTLCNSIVPYYFSEFVATRCETGDFEAAMKFSPGNMVVLGIAGRRPSHGTAGVYLMQGLWLLKWGDNQLHYALHCLRKAKTIYEALNHTYLGEANPGVITSIRHFSTSAGLAMIAHVELRFTETVTAHQVLSCWRTALNLGESSLRKLGGTSFPEMIISYSMSDVTNWLGLQELTTQLMDKAQLLYQVTGRQFHYLALGSIWMDLVQEWNTENGLARISKLDCKGYLEEQRKGGYPYAENSARLCK